MVNNEEAMNVGLYDAMTLGEGYGYLIRRSLIITSAKLSQLNHPELHVMFQPCKANFNTKVCT